MELNNIASPMQSVRDVLDLMPTDTIEDWSVIADRLAAVPAAIGEQVWSCAEFPITTGTMRVGGNRG